MGQYWQMLDLDSRTVVLGMGKLGESFFDEGETVRGLLCRAPFDPVPLKYGDLLDTAEEVPATSSLMILPHDIIDVIFGFLSDRVDMLCFAFTSRKCYRAGERHIFAFIKKWADMSAGHRVIIVGEHCIQGDLPEGLELSEREKVELSSKFSDIYHDPADQIDPDQPLTLSRVADYGFKTLPRDERDRGLYSVLSMPVWRRFPSLERSFFRGELRLVDNMMRNIFPDTSARPTDDSILVLRNLSRRLYIPGTAVVRFNQEHGPGRFDTKRDQVRKICLGDAVLARICWCYDGSGAMNYNGLDMHRGVWAGDRFDIVYARDFESEREAEVAAGCSPWRDVAEEVLAEVETIWMADNLISRRDPGDATSESAGSFDDSDSINSDDDGEWD
ncbi:hypothetical protein BD626DRAFT_628414 [Schizophyllum amplum]|uniref:F-box domain-containing protein n=1 Tax=Schizophyllum amplum TaxID=97359 RepID=A0A550CK58_9AGAR|nr:hypothetical protein BD626DRAFT_628414 [Auriculariopsis ampla]